MRTVLKVNLIFFHLEIDVARAIGELRLLLRFNLVFLPLLALSFCAAGYIFHLGKAGTLTGPRAGCHGTTRRRPILHLNLCYLCYLLFKCPSLPSVLPSVKLTK